MPQDVYGQFLRYAVSESAASTLTEGGALITGAQSRLSGGGFLALEVHYILGVLAFPEDNPAATTSEIARGAISTRSGLASMPDVTDESTLYKRSVVIHGGVATYIPEVLYEEDMPAYATFPIPLLISHPKLYPYVLSTNSSNPQSFKGHIFYNLVDISGDLAVEALEVFR